MILKTQGCGANSVPQYVRIFAVMKLQARGTNLSWQRRYRHRLTETQAREAFAGISRRKLTDRVERSLRHAEPAFGISRKLSADGIAAGNKIEIRLKLK
ncbi:MAG: hypothetical protein ACOX8B_05330 [Lachnospiraceae bacterium]|jgi:hypothetical protein